MAKKILFLLVLFSFKGFSQEYLYKKFSIGQINGNVYDILDDSLNDRVFIAGTFTTVAGVNIKGIASFNRTTGILLTSFNANLGGTPTVKSLAYKNGLLYFSGALSTVGGISRNYVAAVDASSGVLNSWYPIVNATIDDIEASGNYILLSGNFSLVNGVNRQLIAAVDPTTGVTISSFNANANNTATASKMLFYNNSVFLTFNTVLSFNSVSRNYIAKLDANTGVLSSWNPSPNSSINDMTLLNNDLVVVGTFTNIVGATHYYSARLNLNTGTCLTPNSNIFYNPSGAGLFLPTCLSSTTFTNWLTPIGSGYNIDACAAFEDIIMYNNKTGNYGNTPLTVFGKTDMSLVNKFDFFCCYGGFPDVSSRSDYWIEGLYTICPNEMYEILGYFKSVSSRLYTIDYGMTKGTLCPPNIANSRLECWIPMPKIPTAINGSTVVCAGTKNHKYTIPKFKYTYNYNWSYTGTGVSMTPTDTSIILDFSPYATSGKLIVHCIGEVPRKNPCSAFNNQLPDSVFLNITVNPIPSVNAGPNLISNCTNNKVVTLNGAVSGNKSIWTSPTTSTISVNPSVTVINPSQGNYVLSSTYTTTGCSWRDTTYVTVDTIKPNLVMPVIPNTRLCCTNPSVNLNASSSTTGVVYNWTNNNGYSSSNPALISTTSPTIPLNTMTYSLTLTNPNNGCISKSDITLLLDTIPPSYGITVSPAISKISCTTTSAIITGTCGVARAKLFWNGSGLSTNSSNPATVTIPTTYTLMARDTINGCQSYVNYNVLADTVKPVINPLAPNKYLTCDTTQVTLNATSPSVNTTFTWTPPIGAALPNPSFVTNSGTYVLNATDVTNGCSRTRNLTVIVDTIKPNLSTNVDSVMLSCSTLSYTLNANSITSPVTINWAGTGGYTSPNPATVTNQGFYTTTVKNTFNGCINNKLIKVSIDSLKPYIIPFSNNFQINCSYTTAVLSGTTIPANQYKLLWNGIASFSSQNPATVVTPGSYTFTALDTVTGCQSVKFVKVNYQPVLAINAGNDTTICFGTSANLKASPIGGTPNFNYTWSNGTATNTTVVSPNDTTSYVVTVSDNAGCIGKDTVVVIVPAPIQDSSKTFLPCDPNSPFGQIQTYPYGGIPPYQFAIGSGLFQTSTVFLNLALDSYTITIKDNLGCLKTTTATINNNSLRPEPNFLISTKMFKSDTFVVVDISNPRPDSVQWSFSPTCTLIDNSNPFSPVIVNSDTGTFVINLKAFFGTCQMNKAKLVHVGNIDTTLANTFNNNGIESIALYPNPNSGQFNVEVKLYKKQTFAILIYDASGVERYRQTINESNYFNQLINMTSATPGSYILKVIAEYDVKQKPFIITQ